MGGEEATPAPLASVRLSHPGGNPWANLKSIAHRCYLAFVWELTQETFVLPRRGVVGRVSRGEEATPAPFTSVPGGNPWANLKSTSHRCYLAFVWELTCRFAPYEETVVLPPMRSRREGLARRGGDTRPLGVRP